MRGSITPVPLKGPRTEGPVQTPMGQDGSPQGLHISPCCCTAQGAQPQSGTHQHLPACGGLGLPAPCPGCPLTSWTCSPMASSL